MTTKEALNMAMQAAAGYTNRTRALLRVSMEMDPGTFEQLAGQHPSTMQRDVDWAHRDFERCKAAYEAHCQEIGVPAYATYNED